MIIMEAEQKIIQRFFSYKYGSSWQQYLWLEFESLNSKQKFSFFLVLAGFFMTKEDVLVCSFVYSIPKIGIHFTDTNYWQFMRCIWYMYIRSRKNKLKNFFHTNTLFLCVQARSAKHFLFGIELILFRIPYAITIYSIIWLCCSESDRNHSHI